MIISQYFSVSLCFEDIYTEDNAELKYHLKILNEIFVLLFTLEMVLKWAAFGIRKYFRSVWTCLDFVIVLVKIFTAECTLIDIALSGFHPQLGSGGQLQPDSLQILEDCEGTAAAESDIPLAGHEGEGSGPELIFHSFSPRLW